MSQNTRAMRAGAYQSFYQGFHEDIWRAWTVPGFQPAINRGLEVGGHG